MKNTKISSHYLLNTFVSRIQTAILKKIHCCLLKQQDEMNQIEKQGTDSTFNFKNKTMQTIIQVWRKLSPTIINRDAM